jgi:endoplasmic reticulum resident protein 44
MHPQDTDIVAFRPDRSKSVELDETYKGNVESFDELLVWVQSLCVPLVREITFENAEELTEEGLPFLILFHHPDDKESVKKYIQIVHEQLQDEKRKLRLHAHAFMLSENNRIRYFELTISSRRHNYIFDC